MSIDTSVGRVEGVRVSIDTSVQVSGQGSVSVPIGAAWAAWPAAALAYAGPSPALLGLAGLPPLSRTRDPVPRCLGWLATHWVRARLRAPHTQ